MSAVARELLHTDKDRLWRSLMELAEIGATPGGGVGRLALTEEDRRARDRFVGWCREAGLAVRVDRLGNIFARREGREPQAPPVMTGSHLDTQPLGGRFDGAYGVLAGLEVMRALDDAGAVTRAPLEVAVWTDEEGSRFTPGMAASGAFAGVVDVEQALAIRDRDGTSIAEALAAIGYAGDEPVGGRAVGAFFEAHIEQGPLLELERKVIGVVGGAQGQRCFAVTVTGEEGHAGTLPMTRRRDALLGAARMIDALNQVAFDHRPHPVITVGRLDVRPNSPNTIAGECRFTIDSRHPDDQVLDRIEREMRAECARMGAGLGLEVSFAATSRRGAVDFDPGCIELLREVTRELNFPWRDMRSAAAHDACHLARAAPTAMIFVPCRGGISHNERESAEPEHLAAGADVLLNAMLRRAG